MFPIKDTQSLGKFPAITIFIIALNAFVFIQEVISPNQEAFIISYALIPDRIDFLSLNSLSPFITSQFVHAGFFHILPNMWFLWVFGNNLEAAMGKSKFIILYLFSGIIAALVQYSVLVGSSIPMLGASGAVAGVLGAYLKLFPRHRIETIILIVIIPLFLVLPAALVLMFWFFTQIFSGVSAIITNTGAEGGVAWWAHVGGFTTGWLLATFWGPKSIQVKDEKTD